MNHSTRGLTLVELLAALAIFLGLAGMVIQVLGGGLELWTTGERSRQSSEQGTIILDRLAEELRLAVTTDAGDVEPRIKFYSDYIEQATGGDGIYNFKSQRLLFVRRLVEEKTHPLLRDAGTQSGAGMYFTGQTVQQMQELREQQAEDEIPAFFRATEGLCEVVWLPLPDDRPGYEGRLVLWRGLRSPIGGDESLFASIEDRDGGLAEAHLEPLIENLLFVGMEFIDSQVEDVTQEYAESGPSVTWDSTRGILPAGASFESFRHGRSRASRNNPDDDIFPLAVRLTVIVEPPPGEGATVVLLDEISSNTTTARAKIRGGKTLRDLGPGKHLVRLGHEWVEINECDGREVLVVGRGKLGTADAPHAEGTRIMVGRKFQRTIFLPMSREDLNRVPRMMEMGQ